MAGNKIYAVSIFWRNDRNELLEMLDALGLPAENVGADGGQFIVTDGEMETIRSYSRRNADKVYIEEQWGLTPERMKQVIEGRKPPPDRTEEGEYE